MQPHLSHRRRSATAGHARPPSVCTMLAALLLGFAADTAALSHGADRTAPRGMFELYEDNRRNGIPSYVTEDFLVLGYLMLLERTVQRMEADRLVPAFSRLIKRLAAGLDELPQGEIRQANGQFLSVLAALLDPDLTDPDLLEAGDPSPELEGPVRTEVERVLAARGQAFSQVASQHLDYSQFRVRGRYAHDPELRRYFRAVRYAGMVLFAVQPSKATAITAETADRLTAQALQLGRLIAGRDDARSAWEDLERQADWWFGPADDLELEDLLEVDAGNAGADLPELRRRLFERARARGRQPRILGSIVHLDQLEPPLTAYDALTGWRLFPQRYSSASAALQRLVYDRVGSYLGTGRPKSLGFAGGRPVKALPSALELMALLGSEHAAGRLDATDERNYEGYAEAAEEARPLLWESEGLGGEHLALLRYWLGNCCVGPPLAGRPAEGGQAQQGSAEGGEDARRTNTALAFWTYQRYVGLLYSKQSYSGVSKGFAMPPERTSAWLEPAAELYARLARGAGELAARTECGPCTSYARILERCIQIAVAERAGLELGAGDVDFLNDLDHQLFKLIGRRDRPIVVDVHSDPASRRVVQEGIGWPRVIEKDLGPEQISRGALFRHLELHRPMNERLDDDAWSALLLAGEIPVTQPTD